MKKIIISTLLLAMVSATAFAQKSNTAIPLNNENIQKTVIGDWNIINIQPANADVKIKNISIKGAGYGEVMKQKEDGTEVSIICKIYAQNNSEIMFSDAEGYRIIYKVISLTKNTMSLSNGKFTVDYKKQ
jgi:hypothetical protein